MDGYQSRQAMDSTRKGYTVQSLSSQDIEDVSLVSRRPRTRAFSSGAKTNSPGPSTSYSSSSKC